MTSAHATLTEPGSMIAFGPVDPSKTQAEGLASAVQLAFNQSSSFASQILKITQRCNGCTRLWQQRKEHEVLWVAYQLGSWASLAALSTCLVAPM